MLNGVRWLQLKEEFWLLFTNFLGGTKFRK